MKKGKPFWKKSSEEITELDKFIMMNMLESVLPIYSKAKEHRERVLKYRKEVESKKQ